MDFTCYPVDHPVTSPLPSVCTQETTKITYYVPGKWPDDNTYTGAIVPPWSGYKCYSQVRAIAGYTTNGIYVPPSTSNMFCSYQMDI